MAESKFKTLSTSGAHHNGGRGSAHSELPVSGPMFSASQLERGLDEAFDDLRPGSVPEIGEVIGDKYRVEALIARGGMGAVYAAAHVVSGKRVAVKWMLPTLGQIKGARERFIREACATARIAHPNIVDIYDVGSERGSVYLVMELLRGETLSQRMSSGQLREQDAIALLLPALRGVAAAHAHGVIHRDLKPDNIFLCRSDDGEELQPKVLDFGISKITTDEVRNLALTHSGAVLGTPYYMSPEQVRGARDVDARADVYAFGVMLFEALTGQRPFDAETYNELILKIATEPAPNAADLNPNLNPQLVGVVERAMARDPNQRFANIESLALALEPFAGGARFRAGRTVVEASLVPGNFPLARIESRPARSLQTPLEVAPPPRSRLRLVAAVAAIAACAGSGWFLLREPREPAGKIVSIARPAPPPPAREPEPEPQAAPAPDAPDAPVAAPRDNETSVLAAQAPTPAPAKPAAKRATAPRDKRWLSDPPVPEPSPTPSVTKRALPRDWDDRLSADPPRSATAPDVPAGRLDPQDFR